MDILEDIQRQIDRIEAEFQTPAVVMMSEDTWQSVYRQHKGLFQGSGAQISQRQLCGLPVKTNPAMKSGVARVYCEWDGHG